ncbi:uncharacterized protein LOC126735217 isoform X2 [Anthonomus grandis grandis]|uniref:uncharacterized protein LOC126735217 isoform X2 n=1 Tax=Anthonomus grandis grandis TaxID=2921223 RepID=UPI0021659657|nr:uncharacterized protein LOC126735217 isoform X2 [Anthonomus grandis grandis]
MNHIYYKVETDHSSPFRINAIFKADCLELTVLKDGAAYYLEVPQELLITLGKNQGMNFAEYFPRLKNYFETRPDKIEILFKDARFSVNVLLDNKMKKIYFQASLNLVSYEDTVLNMLDNLNKARITYFESLTEEQNKNIKVTAAK